MRFRICRRTEQSPHVVTRSAWPRSGVAFFARRSATPLPLSFGDWSCTGPIAGAFRRVLTDPVSFLCDKVSDASDHEVNGPDFCEENACAACTETACDHFRPHTHGAYQSGELWRAGQGRRSLMSVYQVQLEYVCDLSDNAQTWVPYSVREDAANGAGWLANHRFIEKVPYWCGSTRPLWGARPGGRPEWCTDQNRESCHGGCKTGTVCGNDGCCIEQCPPGSTCWCPSGASCSANYTCVGANYSCDQASGCCLYNVIK